MTTVAEPQAPTNSAWDLIEQIQNELAHQLRRHDSGKEVDPEMLLEQAVRQISQRGKGTALPPIEQGMRFSDIAEKEVQWLWQKRIPLGKITMADGLPDQGKSLVACDLIARVTRGDTMPDGTPGLKGAAIIVATEDDAADTLKPRLLAAHADVTKVITLTTIRYHNDKGEIDERPFTLPRDLPVLEEQILKEGAVLVVLDPLMAILDPQLKSHNDQDVRQALTPLARMLERTACACLIIRHFNKGLSDNAILRGAGSMGIIGAARAGLIVAADPDDPERHILACTKHNLSSKTSNLVYRVRCDSFGRPAVEWLGTSDYTTAELLSTTKPSAGRQEILHILKEAETPIGALDVIEKVPTMTYEQARQLLSRMAKENAIVSVSRGKYTLSQLSQSSQSHSPEPEQEQESVLQPNICDDCDNCDNTNDPSLHDPVTSVIPSEINASPDAIIEDMPPAPARPCFHCQTQNWRHYQLEGEMPKWGCGTCCPEIDYHITRKTLL